MNDPSGRSRAPPAKVVSAPRRTETDPFGIGEPDSETTLPRISPGAGGGAAPGRAPGGGPPLWAARSAGIATSAKAVAAKRERIWGVVRVIEHDGDHSLDVF